MRYFAGDISSVYAIDQTLVPTSDEVSRGKYTLVENRAAEWQKPLYTYVNLHAIILVYSLTEKPTILHMQYEYIIVHVQSSYFWQIKVVRR